MSSPFKDKVSSDLKQAKETGQLRAGRIREIVQAAVSQVAAELRTGSTEVRTLVKDAVAAVVENLQDRGQEIKEDVTESIEGAIEGITDARRQTIAKTQAEVKQLQSRLEQEESQLEQDIDAAVRDVEVVGQDTPASTRSAVESAVEAFKDSEEAALLKKRYAQLQAQLEIVRANLAARYGGRYDDVKGHLDEAHRWYEQARPQAETTATQIQQRHAKLEEQLGEAGTSLAKRERRIRQILSELLHSAAEWLRENPVRVSSSSRQANSANELPPPVTRRLVDDPEGLVPREERSIKVD